MAAVLFVGLNVFDALLTKMNLAVGAEELNPIAVAFGANMLAKALIAVGIVVALYVFGRERMLWWANFGFLAIVLWNLQILGLMNLSLV
ncbi:DUF5658 family protein [Chloroflexota bacterium]